MKIFIRADASYSIGIGHVFRTLVLAQQLKKKGDDVCYLCRDLPGLPKKRILEQGLKLQIIPSHDVFEDEVKIVKEIVKQEKVDWLIVDHYCVKKEYYSAIHQQNVKILAIDDINHTEFPVEILLNQNINAEDFDYICKAKTVQLRGPRYALVRPVYGQKMTKVLCRDSLNNILVFMGGADQDNQTLKVIKAIFLSQREVAVDVVLGPSYRYRAIIEDEIKKNNMKCTIHQNLEDLSDLMMNADLAIGSGGSVTWEMATMKLPVVFMSIAENQIGITERLEKEGASINTGYFRDVSEDDLAKVIATISSKRIQDMSQKMSHICDGNGANLVVQSMQSIN